MVKQVVRIATRQSKLALWQAYFVRDRLLEAHTDVEVELVGMTTKGDRWLAAPLSEVGGKGLFVKELEAAMLDGRADIAVHSAKDLPAELPPGFSLPVLGFRAAVADVIVSQHGSIDTLPSGAIVGSSSLRRRAQLLAHRNDLDIQPIRGNVDSRLAKLDAGEFDAIVLAQAGLDRLAIEREDIYPLPLAVSLPAPGQGALGIECLNDSPAIRLLDALISPDEARCVQAERMVSRALGADCSLPIAAYARIQDDSIHLTARIAQADGGQILESRGVAAEPDEVGQRVVESLFAQGAQAILNGLRQES